MLRSVRYGSSKQYRHQPGGHSGCRLVSLALVSAYFEQQERDYLEAQASVFMPSVTQALRHNNNRDFESGAAIASLLNQVRIRVIDQNGAVVADSGSRSALTYFDESMLQSRRSCFSAS